MSAQLTNPDPNARVLLVDDYEMIRVMLRNGLTQLGFKRIEEAKDGAEAMAKIQAALSSNDPYQMVFCDWNMPNKTGIEVLQECRGNASTKNLPFVMVTAESEQERVIQALKAGADDYIVKPIAVATLQKKIAKLLQKISARMAQAA